MDNTTVNDEELGTLPEPHAETPIPVAVPDVDDGALPLDAVDEVDAIPELPSSNHNVHMAMVPVKGLAKLTRNAEGNVIWNFIDMNQLTNKGLQARVADLGTMDVKGEDETIWQQSALFAQDHALTMVYGDSLLKSLEKEGSAWYQNAAHSGEDIKGGRPSFNNPNDKGEKSQQLTGQRALMRMQALTSTGATVQYPLYGTGIWVTLRPPSDAELLALETTVNEEKIELGRQYTGFLHSASMVYLHRHLFDLFLTLLYDTSLHDWTEEKLRSLIKVTDMQEIARIMAITIYPNGFNAQIPCLNDPTKCNHIERLVMDIGKMGWVDRTALSTEQTRFMRNRLKKSTLAEIQDYQTRGRAADGLLVRLSDDVRMRLKVPTISEYIEAGYTWLAELDESVRSAFGESLSELKRRTYVRTQYNLSMTRQYSHWVGSLVLNDGSYIEEQPTLGEAISHLTGNDDITKSYFEHIDQFIADSAITLTALPSYRCPSCQTPMSDADSKHPYLIPQDAVKIFFTLTALRLSRGKTS